VWAATVPAVCPASAVTEAMMEMSTTKMSTTKMSTPEMSTPAG
jgi:hypothetical protein